MEIGKTENYEEVGSFNIEIGPGIDVELENIDDKPKRDQVTKNKEEPFIETNDEQDIKDRMSEERDDEIKELHDEEVKVTEDKVLETNISEKENKQRPEVELVEACASQVIEFQGKKVVVLDSGVMLHQSKKEVVKKLYITQTNAFIDKSDVERLYVLAQQCSLNGIDPFSSPQALKDMFDRAIENGIIGTEQAPDLTKNIIIGNKVYFTNGQIADLDEEVITFDIGQLERILEAESPEQMKEMVEQIRTSRAMDGVVKSTLTNSERTNGVPVNTVTYER